MSRCKPKPLEERQSKFDFTFLRSEIKENAPITNRNSDLSDISTSIWTGYAPIQIEQNETYGYVTFQYTQQRMPNPEWPGNNDNQSFYTLKIYFIFESLNPDSTQPHSFMAEFNYTSDGVNTSIPPGAYTARLTSNNFNIGKNSNVNLSVNNNSADIKYIYSLYVEW